MLIFSPLLAYKPDLVLVAFGMNDGTGIEPKDFSDNIEAIVKQILAARSDTEIVLVSLHAAKSGDSQQIGETERRFAAISHLSSPC